MIALYREPLNYEVHDEHEQNCAATLCECELPGYAEQVWQIRAARRWQAIKAACNFLVAIACVGAVVVFVWSFRMGQ